MEATAQHNFIQTSEEELSFNAGDNLIIYDYGSRNEGWFEAERVLDGRRGQVPSNYIKVIPPRWWEGSKSRLEAEKMLSSPNLPDGAFLIRLSESVPRDYSLSVRCNGSVQHFRILKDMNDYTFYLWNSRFKTLNELVNNYRTESVSRSQQIFLRDMEETPRFVQALFDFPSGQDGIEDNELQFKAGDIIQLIESDDENWWAGRIDDRRGYFPRTFVQLCDSI